MAQLGELSLSRKLLSRAARAFRGRDPGAYARCVAAEAEVLLECRDLAAAGKSLETALTLLDACEDRENAWFCRLQLSRRLVLVGRLGDADRDLSRLERKGIPPRMRALAELLAADIAVRRIRPDQARAALERALAAAVSSGIAALVAEVRRKLRELEAPVGTLSEQGAERLVTLQDVAKLAASPDVLVDTCRREVREGKVAVPLLGRPVLLALARALGEAWPHDAHREALIQAAFGGLRPTESIRARLRVEIGRLRRALAPIAEVNATARGFALAPRSGRAVRVLHPPTGGDAGALRALLSGGEPWSTGALAEALGTSARTVQRALLELEKSGSARAIGKGRARRWVAADLPGFATSLLLVARLPRH